MTGDPARDGGSFRDPGGFIFTRDGVLYRQVNDACRAGYDLLIASGLYEALVADGLLIKHDEAKQSLAAETGAHKVLRPEVVPFISYPYEWSFSQLKDAALLTLRAQKTALSRGMSLKDASAYNVQFHKGRPVLIDTLSFEPYREGAPWVAYRQFCQHFLAPLALMSLKDARLSSLLRTHIDGIPLDLASGLLPRSSWLSPRLTAHLHLHARFQRRYADAPGAAKSGGGVSVSALLGIVESLEAAVLGLRWKPEGDWADYYGSTNYDDNAFRNKRDLVSRFLDDAAPGSVWDLGANVGEFSRLSSQKGISTVSIDGDPAAVERNYLRCVKDGDTRVLPLTMDLSNPSPSLGWMHGERKSLAERGPADLILALALVHHLAIGNNVPLPLLADFFASAGRALIVEFIPKDDSQAKRLLASREDVFPRYTKSQFENEFSRRFSLDRTEEIGGSQRTLYLMRRR